MDKFVDDLKETIIAYVRKQIFEDRVLSPGSQLNEREIARVLNISRAPIREAFKELEAQGFIVAIKYRGWFVAKLSQEEIVEVNTIRTILEHSLFETAIRQSSFCEADLLPAERANFELGEIAREEVGINRVYSFMEKEMEFHMQLHALARENCLWTRKILTNLSYQIRLSFIDWLYEDGYMQHSFETHSAMLKCLRERDLDGLQRLLSQRLARQCRIGENGQEACRGAERPTRIPFRGGEHAAISPLTARG